MSKIDNIEIYAIAIIPAKGTSARLSKKNLRKINNKTLIEFAINYAQTSKYIKEIYVSTDSDEIKEIANNNDVKVFDRPKDLLGEAEVADIYVDLINKIPNSHITHVVGLQPDHPDRQNKLDTIIKYFIEKKYMDLVTVNKNGTRNGSVRVIKAKNVISGVMSRRVGSILDNCTNVELESQFETAKQRIIKGDYYEKSK